MSLDSECETDFHRNLNSELDPKWKAIIEPTFFGEALDRQDK